MAVFQIGFKTCLQVALYNQIILPGQLYFKFGQISDIYYQLYIAHEKLLESDKGPRVFTSGKKIFSVYFLLFPYPKNFWLFFYSLEKIGIDEKVICYHNISN